MPRPKLILLSLIVSALPALGQTTNILPGAFDHNTYTNRSLGLVITLPPGLLPNDEAMAKSPHAAQTTTLIQAWGEKRPLSQRPGMVLYADLLSQYPPSRRSSAAYIARVTRSQVFNGYQVMHGKPYGRLGSYLLNRTDLASGPIREAVLVTVRRGWALVFIFAGADENEINELMAGTRLQLQEAKEN